MSSYDIRAVFVNKVECCSDKCERCFDTTLLLVWTGLNTAKMQCGWFNVCDEFLADVNLRSRSLYAIARPSVCLSVTLVHPTQLVAIFGNFFTIR